MIQFYTIFKISHYANQVENQNEILLCIGYSY